MTTPGAFALSQPAAPSFQGDRVSTLLTLDFGDVREGDTIAAAPLAIYNLADPLEGAGLAYEDLFSIGEPETLGLSGIPFPTVAPGHSTPLSVTLDTMTPGLTSVSYVLSFTNDGFQGDPPASLAIAAFARVLDLADYNSNGVVDQGDYSTWSEAYGVGSSGPADGNRDGVIDAADYVVWRDRQVTVSISSTVVPCPAGASLTATGVWFALAASRRR